jgi:hypothetical protein
MSSGFSFSSGVLQAASSSTLSSTKLNSFWGRNQSLSTATHSSSSNAAAAGKPPVRGERAVAKGTRNGGSGANVEGDGMLASPASSAAASSSAAAALRKPSGCAAAAAAVHSGTRERKLPTERKGSQDDEFQQHMQLAMQLSQQTTTGNDGAGSSRSHLAFTIEISKASIMNVQVILGDQVYNLNLQWGQQYVTFINELIAMMATSACPLSRKHAALPYHDFRNSVRWQECQHIPRSKDTLSMHEVIQPISDDDRDKFTEHQVFSVNIEQLQEAGPGVTNLFGSEDIVTTMLENMNPWYEPRNLGVLVAFSATCWGALKVVRQVIGGATTDVTPHLPSPFFYNGRPSVLEAHHQWHPSMDRWLRPWRQLKLEYNTRRFSVKVRTV